VEAKSRPQEFLIKRLQLRCDRLVIADYSGRQPVVRELASTTITPTKTSRVRSNWRAARQPAGPRAGAIGGLAPEAGAALRAAGDKFKESGRKAGEAVKGFFESLEKSLKK